MTTEAITTQAGSMPRFAPGDNIAIKVPPHLHEATVRFYRDVVGLRQIADRAPDVVFDFGGKQLWIDSVDGMSQAETWLELRTSDIEAASAYLQREGVVRCDSIEPLPEGMPGFWVLSPCSIVHLVCEGEGG